MTDKKNKDAKTNAGEETASEKRLGAVILALVLFFNLYSSLSYSSEEGKQNPKASSKEQMKKMLDDFKGYFKRREENSPSYPNKKSCQPVSISPKVERYKDLKRLPPGCPGYDDFDPGVLNMEMNGIKVNIPREYYKHAFPDADGPYISQVVRMFYPDLSPNPKGGQNDKKMEITVTLDSPLRSKYCSHGRCPHNSQRRYESEALGFYYRGEHTKIEDSLPEKVDYLESIDMSHFKNASYDVYFRGDIKKPDYWFTCKVICTSRVWLHDEKFAIRYRFFQRELLSKHDEIRNKLIKKFEEFIQE